MSITINLSEAVEKITATIVDGEETITATINELPRGVAGPTGPEGPAGPNSVTSATTSNGTAELTIASLSSSCSILCTGIEGSIEATGANAVIAVTGAGSAIIASGSGSYIETSGAYRIINSGAVATLSATLTANRAISFPDRTGTLAMGSGTNGAIVSADVTDASSGATDESVVNVVAKFGANGELSAATFYANSLNVQPGGNIVFTSTNTGGLVILSGESATSARSIAFPDADGTLALTTSNVATATALQTARTINGVSFNGTANITVQVPVSTGITGLGSGVASWLTTPSGANLANALTTALPASKGGTGLTSLGTGVATWLGTPTAANLRAAVTDFGDFTTIGPAEVSITGTTTLTATAFGKQHVCSGTSTDYAVTLPSVSGNAGRIISIRMSNALTKFVTITAAGGATIDGAATRIMWAQECCVLLCDGTNWTKIAGKTRPMMCSGENGAGVSVTNNTITPISLATTINDGTGAMIDTVSSTKVIRIRRPGNYNISSLVTLERSGNTPGFEAYCAPLYNTLTAAFASWFTSPAFLSVVPTAFNGAANSYAHISLSGTRRFNLSDYIALAAYQTTGGTMTTRTTDIVRPNMAVIEIPEW